MHEEEKQIKKRILELADKSYRNSQYLFTSFLTPAEYSCLSSLSAPLSVL